MTALASKLRERIRSAGPITFCDWMHSALYDQQHGYYCRHAARWGAQGDYRTSPERSSLFASTFSRYFVSLFDDLGSPGKFSIFESGGGAGDFASRVLATIERDAPECYRTLNYVFDEISEDARAMAASRLARFSHKVEFRSLREAGDGEFEQGIIFANELLDAFPAHRLVMRSDRVAEFYVDINANGEFALVEGAPSSPELLQHLSLSGAVIPDGQIIEVNLEALRWVRQAARALGAGFLIVVDYGDDAESLYAASHRRDGTLRAFRRHAIVEDFLQTPGESDLTTTVNWTEIQQAGESEGLRTILLESQDKFLLSAGLLDQLERETRMATDEVDVTRLRLDAREMILPGGMAEHFQVLVQRKP